MPDWKRLVRERLATTNLPAGVREDVAAELAAHLEDAAATDLELSGAPHRALDHMPWRKLVRAIEHAKCEEDAMNHRTKAFWLPALAILFAAGLALVFLDRAAVLQRLIWIGCMAMFLCAAASEANHLNQRIRGFWLPGFVSLTAAIVFLFAADIVYDPFLFFREICLQPQNLVRWNSGSPRPFYIVWLVAQVAFGAVGALLSGRMGGSRKARIIAGLFPAMVIVATNVVLVPLSALISGQDVVWRSPAYLASAAVIWMVAPAMAVVAGALPFLRRSELARG